MAPVRDHSEDQVMHSLFLKKVSVPYASSIVFLFLGGCLIAIVMEKWNLHRRIALLTLFWERRTEADRGIGGLSLILSLWLMAGQVNEVVVKRSSILGGLKL
ncbi:anion permease [Halomonas sp. I1]|uniref:anion permease n=1 Tax=Halomonas sp. I1 TaxID=393536 RepID=UPI0028DD6324|nr:anion permease [Halomonas sp. I1]MDT8896054.1 anion permease [Halomonas sp. I1]